MKKMTEAFLNATKLEKCAFIVGLISSIIVIICGFLQILGIWNMAIDVCEVFMGIEMISQAILQWKKNRGVAIFSLCVAIFIFAVAIFIIFVHRGI